jgi:cell fate (sporulation/competence/biofilm development) regulator YlbF (YheA/YmcA/DUF963 family)
MNTSPLIQSKIIDLCNTLAADADVRQARIQAETFLADEGAVSLYKEMASLGRALHQKQHQGVEPSEAEITRFNDLQDRCEASEIISGFLGAQDVLQNVSEAVNAFVGRTLESGRVPTAEELAKKGGCGEGCGCH